MKIHFPLAMLAAVLLLFTSPLRAQTQLVNDQGLTPEGQVCTMNPVVSNDGNSGAGTLRQAVLEACAGSTITFSTTGTIPLSGGQITIDKNLTIAGPGANLVTVQNAVAGSTSSRVFRVNAGVTATIAGLTITGGNNADTGGGISNSGTLTVSRSTISNNQSGPTDTGGRGGGIYNDGTLTLTNSIVSTNLSGAGGGIYNFQGSTLNVVDSTISNNEAHNGGGVYNATGIVTVTNSTLNNNNGKLAGGGLYNDGILTTGVVTVTNSTISGNTVGTVVGATGGGGIYSHDGSVSLISSTITNNSELGGSSVGAGVNNQNGGTVNGRNTIIAGNNGTFRDFAGTLTSQGYNLIGVNSGTTIVGDTTGNLTGTTASPLNAMLAALSSNGGKTMTHALLAGSPAINAGNITTSPAADQRGNFRTGTSDMGAYEFNGSLVRLSSIERNGSTAEVKAELVYGHTYRLERRAEITDAGWGAVSGVNDFVATDNNSFVFSDPGSPNLTKAFYHVIATQ